MAASSRCGRLSPVASSRIPRALLTPPASRWPARRSPRAPPGPSRPPAASACGANARVCRGASPRRASRVGRGVADVESRRRARARRCRDRAARRRRSRRTRGPSRYRPWIARARRLWMSRRRRWMSRRTRRIHPLGGPEIFDRFARASASSSRGSWPRAANLQRLTYLAPPNSSASLALARDLRREKVHRGDGRSRPTVALTVAVREGCRGCGLKPGPNEREIKQFGLFWGQDPSESPGAAATLKGAKPDRTLGPAFPPRQHPIAVREPGRIPPPRTRPAQALAARPLKLPLFSSPAAGKKTTAVACARWPRSARPSAPSSAPRRRPPPRARRPGRGVTRSLAGLAAPRGPAQRSYDQVLSGGIPAGAPAGRRARRPRHLRGARRAPTTTAAEP